MRRLLLTLLCVALASLLPQLPARAAPAAQLRVHFIDVGQGDSILIQAPDGATALIDGGYSGSGALDYLRSLKITRIDVLIASHPHADHIGGLVDVLGALPVGAVYASGASHTTGTFEHFLDAIIAAKVPYHEVGSGDQIPLGALTLDVLRSDPGAADLNDTSLVLRLASGQTSFLFTGDAERPSEEALLKSVPAQLRATVLKVGHHGSRTSSSARFLDAVRPQIAVYSAGRRNSYGHPHASTIAALQEVGARIYGTDRDGTVTVATDGRSLTVTTTRPSGSVSPPDLTALPAPAVQPTVSASPTAPAPTAAPPQSARRSGNPCPSRMPRTAAPGGPLVISAVDKVREIVEIRNTSQASVALDGWAICSVKGGQLHGWLSGAIRPGATLVVPSQAGRAIWNNRERERAAILDAGGAVVSVWEEGT